MITECCNATVSIKFRGEMFYYTCNKCGHEVDSEIGLKEDKKLDFELLDNHSTQEKFELICKRLENIIGLMKDFSSLGEQIIKIKDRLYKLENKECEHEFSNSYECHHLICIKCGAIE